MASAGLIESAMRMWPDVILLVSAFFVPLEMLDLLAARGFKVVLLHTECPYEDDDQIERGRHAHLNLLNDPVNIGRWRAETGVPAEYMPHAYRPAIHHPGPPDPGLASDLAFVGTGFKSRIGFFESMDLDGLDVLLAGNWQALAEDSPLRKYIANGAGTCLGNEETAQVYRSATSGINFYRREGQQLDGWAAGPREVEMAACGLFFLRDPRGEGDGLFPSLPVFTGPQDAAGQLRWWLAHGSDREKAASLAREAITGRTFQNHARELLRLLGKQPVTIH